MNILWILEDALRPANMGCYGYARNTTPNWDALARVFDDLVGVWVRKLEELGTLDDTMIIVTADHGEELMERGHVGHCSCNLHGTLYDESIRVPLIVRYPVKLPRGKVVSQQVSHIDIMPTLFDLVGLEVPAPVEGRSMLPLITGGATAFREGTFAETSPAGWQALKADDREIWCVRTAQWKLILHTNAAKTTHRYELYDLAADPGELRNVYAESHPAVLRLGPTLNAHIAQAMSRR